MIVTGAGRGIGFTLVEQLAERPNTLVYAGVRSLPIAPDSQLALLVTKRPSVVVPIKLTSASEGDNRDAAQLIKEQIGKVDVVIACAGE
jgi:NAD(P)-dependent dehydrogenase (short-subunit alcohol dehydrogenase family)